LYQQQGMVRRVDQELRRYLEVQEFQVGLVDQQGQGDQVGLVDKLPLVVHIGTMQEDQQSFDVFDGRCC
jgi:hypothetical protein